MVNVHSFGTSRAVGGLLLTLGLTACSPTVSLEDGSSGAGANGPTASGGTAGTAGTGGGGPSEANCPTQTLAAALAYNLGPKSSSIAYANHYVYFHANSIDGINIFRVPVTGGNPEMFLKGLPDIPASESFVANATDLYWISGDGSIRKASLDTGVTTVLSMICSPSDPGCLFSMTLDDTYVYFGTSNGGIGRIPLGGGSPDVLVGGQSTSAGVLALKVDSDHLVWTTQSSQTDDGGSVMRIPVAGGGPTVLLPAPLDPVGIALRGDYAYVTDYGMGPTGGPDVFTGTGTIYKIRIDQSEPPVTLATGQPGPIGILADATGVYWGGGRGSSGGPLPAARVPFEHLAENATTAETLVPATIAFSLVPCDGAICWLDGATNDLMRYTECNP